MQIKNKIIFIFFILLTSSVLMTKLFAEEFNISAKEIFMDKKKEDFYFAKRLMRAYNGDYAIVSENLDLLFENRNKFSLNAMTKEFEKILDKYLPEFQQQVDLKLPQLKSTTPKSTSNIKLPTLKKK